MKSTRSEDPRSTRAGVGKVGPLSAGGGSFGRLEIVRLIKDRSANAGLWLLDVGVSIAGAPEWAGGASTDVPNLIGAGMLGGAIVGPWGAGDAGGACPTLSGAAGAGKDWPRS